jgi:hypothetical protein
MRQQQRMHSPRLVLPKRLLKPRSTLVSRHEVLEFINSSIGAGPLFMGLHPFCLAVACR